MLNLDLWKKIFKIKCYDLRNGELFRRYLGHPQPLTSNKNHKKPVAFIEMVVENFWNDVVPNLCGLTCLEPDG